MTKPFYGEAGKTINPGEFPAVISQVANVGHHTDKDGTSRTKLFFALYIPELDRTMRLSYFGLNTWTSPSKPPFIGLYEVVSAAIPSPTETPYNAKEVEAIDVVALLGKSVTVKIEDVENPKTGMSYANITALSPCGLQLKHDDLVSVGIEEFGDSDLVARLDNRAQELIYQSKEYQELIKPPTLDEPSEMSVDDVTIKDEVQEAEIDPAKVPF